MVSLCQCAGRTTHIVFSFHSTEPDVLVDLQQAHWSPLLEWARATFDVEIKTASDSFVLEAHPKETLQKLDELLSTFDEWQMAGKLLYSWTA